MGSVSRNRSGGRLIERCCRVLANHCLVFFGGTLFETKLRAYSADDGHKVWETDIPFSAHSVPGTYEHKGKRYVVVCAGGHGKVDSRKLGGVVLAYTVQ